MSDQTKSTKGYQAGLETIRELQKLRGAYDEYIENEVIPLFRQDDQIERRPPRRFKESSYLYVRSFDGDNGSRPFANQVFWLSPDIQVSPITNLAAYTRTLNAGETYNLRCHIRNRGDRVVPSAKVEFWLTDPALGFDTRFAQHLSLGRVPSAWVNPNTSGVVDFTYPVPPTEAGHKCLFARVFSFSPLELPVDNTRLDPRIDRRIAQLNLNILQQGQPFQFNWIQASNAHQRIEFVPLGENELRSLRHPILTEFFPAREFPQGELIHRAGLELDRPGIDTMEAFHEQNGLVVISSDPGGPDLGELRETRARLHEALAAISAGKSNSFQHRELFALWREMNSQAVLSTFKMQAPDLGLNQDQVAGIHIQTVELDDSGETRGGLTLLITG
jgi:hypothetical protein